MPVELKVAGLNPGVVHFFFLSFFSPLVSFFFLLLSIIPFKLAPPLQCSSIFLVIIYVVKPMHTH